MKPFNFPAEFQKNIIDLFGAAGRAWLDNLPEIFQTLKTDWKFESAGQFKNLTYSYVNPVHLKDGREAVLKISPLGGRTQSEIAWYKHNPSGTPKLIHSDESRGAILMEHLKPGHTLKKLVREDRDDEATEILARAIANLSPIRGSTFAFKHICDLAADLEVLNGKIDPQNVDRARRIFRELTADSGQDVPLHGDIHHDNVLSSGGEWRVIDPHGYIGPRSFEVGAMIRNPFDCFPRSSSLKNVIERRLEILGASLPFSRDEILGWSYAYTMMALAWSAGDHGELPREYFEILDVLKRL